MGFLTFLFIIAVISCKQYIYISKNAFERTDNKDSLLYIKEDMHFTPEQVSHLIREIIGIPSYSKYYNDIHRNNYFGIAKIDIQSYRSRVYKEPSQSSPDKHVLDTDYIRFQADENISELNEWNFNSKIGSFAEENGIDTTITILVPSTTIYSTYFTISFWIVAGIIIIFILASAYSCSEPEKDDELAALLFDAADMQIEPEDIVKGERWEEGEDE